MGVLWSKSGSVEFDNNGVVAAGAKAYFFSGGTSTPAATYSDAAESSVRTHPVVADGNGRWPNVFIPFQTSYDVLVTDADGTQLYTATRVPNSDPVEDVADAVAAEELITTGLIVAAFDVTRTGYVRCNGQTIGSASSGASERANADCEDLFLYLWNKLADGQASVSTGRGASAAADWAANKVIALPDGRAAGFLGSDTMGNSAASRLPISSIFVHGNATTLGSRLGENSHTMTEAEMRAHTHSFSATTSSDGAHTHTGGTSAGSAHSHTGTTDNHNHTYDFPNFETVGLTLGGTNQLIYNNTSSSQNTGNSTVGFTSNAESAHTHTLTIDSGGAHTHNISGTSGSTGSSTAFNTVHNSILVTWFIKL